MDEQSFVSDMLKRMDIAGEVVCGLEAVKLEDGGFYFYSRGQSSPKVYFGPSMGDALSFLMHQFANEKNLVWSTDNRVKLELEMRVKGAHEEWEKKQAEEAREILSKPLFETDPYPPPLEEEEPLEALDAVVDNAEVDDGPENIFDVDEALKESQKYLEDFKG